MKWYEVNPIRFELEKKLLAVHHPGCKLVKESGEYRVELQVKTNIRTYHVTGVFPNRYPNAPMTVHIPQSQIDDYPPHYFDENGELCLYGCGNVGSETTAKVYIDWAKQWIKCYESWQRTRRWPVNNERS